MLQYLNTKRYFLPISNQHPNSGYELRLSQMEPAGCSYLCKKLFLLHDQIVHIYHDITFYDKRR